jgi:hypothetical protein
MTFLAGFALGVLAIIGFSLLTVASDADDVIEDEIDNHTDFR